MATRSNNKLKIGLVLDDTLDTPDGVQQYVLDLGAWLSAAGHDVRYIVGKTHRTDIAGILSLSRNVAVRFNGNRMSIPLPTSKRAIRSLLATEQFDVLHVQMPYSPFMAERVIKLAPARTAIIGTFHILPESWLVSKANRLLALWLRASLHRFDHIMSVSAAAANFAHKTYGVTSTVIPNMVDYQRFHNAKPLPQYNDATPTILFLGRLVPRKGCKVLLQAVALVCEQTNLPPFRVVICGKGPLLGDLQQFVAENNLSNIVEFAGYVSEADKPRYYASADISVFPSSGGESFGIVLLEALASGRAVVLAGDNPGYSSVLADKTELLFPARDPQALANKMTQYLLNQKELGRVSAEGAKFASNFDVATIGAQVEALYKKILQ